MGVFWGEEMPSPTAWKALGVLERFEAAGVRLTLKELADRLGLKAVSAVRVRVLELERLGLVSCLRVGRRGYVAARTVRVTEKAVTMLARYRALAAAGMFVGACEFFLSEAQYARVSESDVPVAVLGQREEGGGRVLMFRNGVERDFWGMRILEVLGSFDAE